jgi:aminodeoxyfutalosine synthase
VDSSRLASLGLSDIARKLDADERLTLEDGVRLFACRDLHALGFLANREREKRHGRRVPPQADAPYRVFTKIGATTP